MNPPLRHKTKSCLCRTIAAAALAGVMPAPGALAQETNGPTEMKPTVITGSYIPTAETVGPAPVQTIGAAEIERVGAQDVLDLVKKVSTAFAGNNNVGQAVNNGGFGEANVEIRNLPTLVMLNGHRLVKSAFSNQGLVDVNMIPLSMVERVEILKDGASALYGSEAEGGVVNIITKENFNGTEIAGRFGFATRAGHVNEERASVISGMTSEKAWFVGGAQYYYMDPLLAQDRSVASLGNAQRAAMDLGAASYISPSFPGKVQAGVGNGDVYLLANSPFLMGQAGYNPNLVGGPPVNPGLGYTAGNYLTPGTPPVFPGVGFSGQSAVANYNAYAIAHGYVDPTGHGNGPYVFEPSTSPLSGALLNTTEFGVVSILSQDRKNAFFNGGYDLFDKHAQIYGEFLYANTESIGALAPSPVLSLGPFDSNINVPANNAYNPFQIALGPEGAATPRVRSRFIQSGDRIFDNQTDFYHIVGGLKGEIDGGYSYDIFYTWNQGDQVQFTRNAVNGAALDLALQPNVSPALAAQGLSNLRGADANFVPMYDIFFSPTMPYPTRTGPNSPATLQALSTSLFEVGKATEWDADGIFRGAPVDLPGGKLSFAAGGGYRSEALNVDFDGLTRIGKVPGLNAAEPTSGRRDSWDILAEVNIPITSPSMNVPAFHSLSVDAAGRYEGIMPGGDSAVPKIGVKWQPLDEQLTLRGNFSKSFVAPTTFQLFGGAAQNNPFLIFPDGSLIQATTDNVSNPSLRPENAEQYGAGIVITPKAIPGLTVSADYYHIRAKNVIFRDSSQAILSDLNQNGSASKYASLFHFDDGSSLTTTAPGQITENNFGSMNVPFSNGAQIDTDGVDVGLNYSLPLDPAAFGRINIFANATVTFNYLYDDPTIHTTPLIDINTGGPLAHNPNAHNTGPYQYVGQYTDTGNGIGGAQGLIPDWQINLGLTWQFHNFTYSVLARYIPPVTDMGDGFPSVGVVQPNAAGTSGKPASDYTADGKIWQISDWYSIDMRLAYEFKAEGKWYDHTTLAIGCNNITDEDPPIISSSFEDNTDKATYDILGRFVYFEISKKF